MISPYFEELSTKYSGVTFLKVDVDAVEVRQCMGCTLKVFLQRAHPYVLAGCCSGVRHKCHANISGVEEQSEGG